MSKADLNLKFVELQTLYSLVEVQVTTIELTMEGVEDDDKLKVFKSELSKMKSVKTKLSKLIKDY